MKRTLRFTWRGSQFKLWNLSGAPLWIWNPLGSANISNPDPSKVPYDAPLPVGGPAPLPPHHRLHALHDGQDASCHGLSQVLFEALVASNPKKIILLLNSRNTPESVSNLLKYKNGDRLLTPRLYTEDKFCCRFHQWIFNKDTYLWFCSLFFTHQCYICTLQPDCGLLPPIACLPLSVPLFYLARVHCGFLGGLSGTSVFCRYPLTLYIDRCVFPGGLDGGSLSKGSLVPALLQNLHIRFNEGGSNQLFLSCFQSIDFRYLKEC